MGWPSRPDDYDLILKKVTPCYLRAVGQVERVTITDLDLLFASKDYQAVAKKQVPRVDGLAQQT
jgi:hypothetical protein